MTMETDRLLHAFPAEFVRFGQTLQPPRPDATPLAALLDPDGLARLVDTYGATLGSTDRRAVLSMWTQYYLLALLPAALAAALVGARQPDLALERAGIVLAPDGGPAAVCAPDRAPQGMHGTVPACPAARLTPLLRTHLEPMVGRLTAAGLPPAVLWSNAGHVVLWALRTILAPPERLAGLRAALAAPVWVDGGANPLHPTVHHGARTVCCLRHRLPGTERCGTCPLVQRAVRKKRAGG